MDITQEEKDWALAIKEALMKEDETLAKSLSDFEYAHHAIIAKDKVPKAIKRIQRLHKFRQDHDIPDDITADVALQCIQKFEAGSPGMFLSFGRCATTQHYLSTWNYSAFVPGNFDTPEAWQNCFAAFYYLFDALQPDLAAVRAGIVMLADAENLGWKNFSLEMEKRAAHLYQDAYPIRIANMTMLHAPVVFKAMYALMKPFLSQKVKSVIHMTSAKDDMKVADQFAKDVLPTTLGGMQTTAEMEAKMLDGLKKRYENVANFKLETATITTNPEGAGAAVAATGTAIEDAIQDEVDC